MATLVVDSSVALKWFLKEHDADQAELVLSAGGELLAPDLVLAEVANGLRRQERANRLPTAKVCIAFPDWRACSRNSYRWNC